MKLHDSNLLYVKRLGRVAQQEGRFENHCLEMCLFALTLSWFCTQVCFTAHLWEPCDDSHYRFLHGKRSLGCFYVYVLMNLANHWNTDLWKGEAHTFCSCWPSPFCSAFSPLGLIFNALDSLHFSGERGSQWRGKEWGVAVHRQRHLRAGTFLLLKISSSVESFINIIL